MKIERYYTFIQNLSGWNKHRRFKFKKNRNKPFDIMIEIGFIHLFDIEGEKPKKAIKNRIQKLYKIKHIVYYSRPGANMGLPITQVFGKEN
jgi:hypothetical protein